MNRSIFFLPAASLALAFSVASLPGTGVAQDIGVQGAPEQPARTDGAASVPGGDGLPLPPALSAGGGASPGTGDKSEGIPAAGERAAPPAAGELGRQRTPVAAASPGRQELPPPAAPVLATSQRRVIAYEPVVLRTFECPREAIERLIASAVEEGEFSEALELEREVLVLCRDRQAILKELVASELELADALQKSAAARAQEALKLETARREADARVEAARQAILEATRAAAERREAAAAGSAPAPAAKPVAVKEKPPEYGWYGVSGRGDDLRAAVTDGTSSWRVRAGDRLPGGVSVVAVEARPPGVVVRGWTADRLPYRQRSAR